MDWLRGFSAAGGDLSVQLNNGAQLTWGSGNFLGSGDNLLFGSSSATNDVTFSNDIDLAGSTRTILATANEGDSNQAILSGVLSNGGLNIGDGSHTGIVVLAEPTPIQGNTHVLRRDLKPVRQPRQPHDHDR